MKTKKVQGSDIALKVEHVSKSFRLPTERANGIKQAFINRMRGVKGYKKQAVLKDISFEVKKGDFFGIVGRNGSGKSTTLKLISQIYTPDSGKITVNGSLVPFIELGVGFNPELTGRENVYLNGAMLGFTKEEIDEMYDDIVNFAELHDFMDQKLKNYSSGMQVRLAFSVAIKAQGDILVLDEVLAVGDEAFQRKCFSYFAELKKEKRTVILVTHDMSSVQRFCNKAILINDGVIEESGSVLKVSDRYQELNVDTNSKPIENNENKQVSRFGQILTKVNKGVFRGNQDKTIFVDNIIDINEDIKDAFFGFTIRKEDGEAVFWYTTEPPRPTIDIFQKNKPLTISLEIQNIFGEGLYYVDVSLKSRDRSKEYIVQNRTTKFRIAGWGQNGWMLHPEVKIEFQKSAK